MEKGQIMYASLSSLGKGWDKHLRDLQYNRKNIFLVINPMNRSKYECEQTSLVWHG